MYNNYFQVYGAVPESICIVPQPFIVSIANKTSSYQMLTHWQPVKNRTAEQCHDVQKKPCYSNWYKSFDPRWNNIWYSFSYPYLCIFVFIRIQFHSWRLFVHSYCVRTRDISTHNNSLRAIFFNDNWEYSRAGAHCPTSIIELDCYHILKAQCLR